MRSRFCDAAAGEPWHSRACCSSTALQFRCVSSGPPHLHYACWMLAASTREGCVDNSRGTLQSLLLPDLVADSTQYFIEQIFIKVKEVGE
ncbi:hypothetical protein SK128_024173 [Halocaridina rubra]|uniref:Uncharacterized protein n=1 Tax=Halocaridina rubra TaxID=373956 RepID=A0AAN8XRA2_HALRR